MCFGGTTYQTSQRSELPPWLEDAYKRLTQQAEAAGGIGAQYVPYGGQRIAPFSAQQQTAMAGADPVSAYYGQERQAFKPYTDYAAQATAQAAAPTTGMVQGYMNPYQQSVIDTTLQEQQRRSDIAGQQQAGQAVKAGAYGGARYGVQQAERERGLRDVQSQTAARINQQAYQQALAAAQSERQRQGAAGQQYGQIAGQEMGLGGQGLAGLYQAGQLGQTQGQAGRDISYEDFQRQQQFPYAQAQYASGILGGMPSPMTTYQQTPTQGTGSRLLGLGIAGIGAYMGAGGTFGSDVRLKDNVKLVGKSPSDINIYSFNYKGSKDKYEGVLAQEVLWASTEHDGYLMVDYSKLDVDFRRLN